MPLNRRSNPSFNALILMFGLFLFSIQDAIIKHFSGDYSALQIVFIRSMLGVILLLLFAILFQQNIRLISKRPGIMVLRGCLGFLSYTGYYLAVAAMPLAEVVSITFTMPLFTTVMSALFLRERVGLRRWSAVVVGFIGVIIILSPEGQFSPLAVGFAFFAAITYASHTILTRVLGTQDHPFTLALNTLVVFTIAGGVLGHLFVSGVIAIDSSHPSLAFLGRDWVPIWGIDLLMLCSLGFIAAAGFFCLSRAYCDSDASAVAPFEYSYIVWAVLFGFLFWGEVPGSTTFVGLVILISSSIYVWYREHKLATLAAAES